MDTNKEPNDGKNSPKAVDARIISLVTYDNFSLPDNGKDEASGYYSFSYYDKIDVRPVDTALGEPLRSAYLAVSENGYFPYDSRAFRQFILAFTDINGRENDYGYTESQIDDFWSNSANCPLFFMSMINIRNISHLECVLREIENMFSDTEHLAYLTFDHCNIILFCRGSEFGGYTSRIFDLNYKCDVSPADSITLFGFSDLSEKTSVDEPFKAFIRLGVRNYQSFLNFKSKFGEYVNKEPKTGKYSECRLLGRNDIGFFFENATLETLHEFCGAALETNDASADDKPWYTTYDLLIPVEQEDNRITADNCKMACGGNDSGDGSDGDDSGRNDDKELREKYTEKLDKMFAEFTKGYLSACDKANITAKMVLLRWLKASYRLSVSLTSNCLSEDLGTCLMPQFEDLLQYGINFFRELNTGENIEKAVDIRDYLEKLEASFSAFFSDVSVIIDSMNQTNREFIQVPSFHLPSFEVPPKIMAFFVAMAYSLKKLLQDDPKTFYGLAVTPQLIKALGVQSLAIQEALPDDQWIEIVISESSFYTLRLTTQTMAHEISHFVGQETRCRPKRKENIIKCAFVYLLLYVLQRLTEVVCEKFPIPGLSENIQIYGYSDLNLKDLTNMADELYKTALGSGRLKETYDRSKNNKLHEVTEIIKIDYFANDISTDPELHQKFFNEICELAKTRPDDSDDDALTVIEYLEYRYLTETGISLDKLDKSENKDVYEKLSERVIKAPLEKIIFKDILEGIDDYDGNEGINIPYLYAQVESCFKETFADLQAIMLFEMDWAQYCELIDPDKGKPAVADSPLRMLCVAKALTGSYFWEACDITDYGSHPKNISEVTKNIFKVINEDLLTSPWKFEDAGFSAPLLYYTSDYLKECVEGIKAYFIKEDQKEELSRLRSTFKCLSDKTTALKLQKEIGEFVDDFRNKVFRKE